MSAPLEVLSLALVLLCGSFRTECAEVTAFSCARILLARIQSVFSAGELADHAVTSRTNRRDRDRWCRDARNSDTDAADNSWDGSHTVFHGRCGPGSSVAAAYRWYPRCPCCNSARNSYGAHCCRSCGPVHGWCYCRDRGLRRDRWTSEFPRPVSRAY